VKREDTLEHDDVGGFDGRPLVRSVVHLEVVPRHLHRPPLQQRFEVVSEEVPLERRRVVVVDLAALLDGEIRALAVVVVERNAGDVVAEVAGHEPRDRRLPRAGSPGDADHERGDGHTRVPAAARFNAPLRR
jgi:hypothetical protein